MKNAIMIGVFVLMNVKQGYVVNSLDNYTIPKEIVEEWEKVNKYIPLTNEEIVVIS